MTASYIVPPTEVELPEPELSTFGGRVDSVRVGITDHRSYRYVAAVTLARARALAAELFRACWYSVRADCDACRKGHRCDTHDPKTRLFEAMLRSCSDPAALAAETRVNDQVELLSLREWVADLQSGMYINCVYCGHRYGPAGVMPATLAEAAAMEALPTMADALRAHIEQCERHPMSELKVKLNLAEGEVETLRAERDRKAELLESTIAVANARAAEIRALRRRVLVGEG